MTTPVAAFIADVHFTELPPVVRTAEADWPRVQEAYLAQVRKIVTLNGNVQIPLFIAGDVFNTPYPSLRLVNHVIRWLRGMLVYGIPGNHDVPSHNYRLLDRSGYWTLVESGVVNHLAPSDSVLVHEVCVHGWPDGFDVQPPRTRGGLVLNVALIHGYVWTAATGHVNAAETQRYKAWAPKLKGYDLAVFGDNHVPFSLAPEGQCKLINCGTFLRRHSDEKGLKPSVWVLHSDGTVKRECLDVSADRFIDQDNDVSALERALDVDLSAFSHELTHLHAERMDFVRIVLHWAERNNVSKSLRSMLLKVLEVRHGYRGRD